MHPVRTPKQQKDRYMKNARNYTGPARIAPAPHPGMPARGPMRIVFNNKGQVKTFSLSRGDYVWLNILR